MNIVFQLKQVAIKNEDLDFDIPCINDLGSCTYKVCEIYEKYRKELCRTLDICHCPTEAGEIVKLEDMSVKMPDLGIFQSIFKGTFKVTVTLSSPMNQFSQKLGCFSFQTKL